MFSLGELGEQCELSMPLGRIADSNGRTSSLRDAVLKFGQSTPLQLYELRVGGAERFDHEFGGDGGLPKVQD